MSRSTRPEQVFTGTAELRSPFYIGEVTVTLNLSTGVLTCFTPQFDFPDQSLLEEESERAHELLNVQITLPLGRLFADRLFGLEFASLSPGTLSVHSTPLTSALNLRNMAGLSAISFRAPNNCFEMEIRSGPTAGAELIYSSHSVHSFPTGLLCGRRWRMLADSDFTHFVAETTEVHDETALHLSWSLLGGSFIQPFVRRVGRFISLYEYRSTQKSAFTLLGRPSNEAEYTNLRPQAFETIYQNIASMSPSQFDAFRINCSLYLSAKAQGNPVESSILSLFSFLEAVDGSRTMNWQTLQMLLDITRSEAEFINSVRNTFVHGRYALGAALRHEQAQVTESGIFRGLSSRFPELEFYLCLLFLIDRYFCQLFEIPDNAWMYTAPLASIRAT